MRFTQYSLMVFGHARIPITGWMREQAEQALAHAIQAGDEVTALGGNVSLGIGELVGTLHPTVDDILGEMLLQERRRIALYRRLLVLAEGHCVSLEELARQMIRNEELDVAEIEKSCVNGATPSPRTLLGRGGTRAQTTASVAVLVIPSAMGRCAPSR